MFNEDRLRESYELRNGEEIIKRMKNQFHTALKKVRKSSKYLGQFFIGEMDLKTNKLIMKIYEHSDPIENKDNLIWREKI